MMPPLVTALLVLASAMVAAARDLHVDPAAGHDRHDGETQPVKTIARGLKLAQPGDTVHLAPVVFKESAVFYQRAGEPGKPIILDGHGATIEGSEPLDPSAWSEVEPGLFRHDRLLPRLDAAIIGRWFFLWGGRMNHMGRTSKGPSAPLKKAAELQPGEWTFVKDDARTLPDSPQIFGAFYVKLPPGQTLAAAAIAAPVRSAGVQFSGDNRHLIIRNLTATHVYNDGFNIHGHCEDVLFENIRALECGDDGISAHETAQYRVDGFVSIGNSTGICDTGASVTSYRRVFIQDCLGHDLYFLDTGRYAVSNAVVLSSASRALALTGRAQSERPCSLRLDNVLIRRVRKGGEVRIDPHSQFSACRTTFENVHFQAAGGELALDQCVITGRPPPTLQLWKAVRWRGERNLYDLRSLRVDQTSFAAENFAAFQKQIGGESGSEWRSISADRAVPAGIGADVGVLEENIIPEEYRAAFRAAGATSRQ